MIRKAITALGLSLICCSAISQANTKQVDPELRLALREAITQADSFADRFDAEVWLMSKSQPLARYIKDPKRRMHVLKAVHREATRAGLRPEIVLAVIQIESAFNPYAVSRVGAQGMMQVMPFWKKEIGRPDDNLIDMDTNLRYGCTILKHYIKKAKGNLANALAYYNGSYGRHTYSSKVLDAWASRWR
ncbi:lytic transglycosylase domain-containing protein [Microbulbifer sp. CnH-101-G]|uniref:lytic transglycosylase domain-containing protein n=1 Tax=Microbulbifer sp. CnH-101-G TaxID=3243393 RepID=UPI00403A1D2C